MRISVVTVALDAAEALPLTLESVIAQDHGAKEFVVVDGASVDDTPTVLDLYRNDVDAIHIIEDGGIYYAMNEALGFVSGDFVLFLNAGDRLHQHNTLSRMAARWDGKADVVFGNHVYRDGSVEAFHSATDYPQLVGRVRRGKLAPHMLARAPAHQATMVRTQLLRELRFDTAFRICADHDLLLRAEAAGARFQYVDEIVAVYAGGGFSAKRSALTQLEWNALYRTFSSKPDVVDQNFYGAQSPFAGLPSAGSGGVMAGALPQAPADKSLKIEKPFRWVASEGLSAITPDHARTTQLDIEGVNPCAGQSLSVLTGGVSRGTKPVRRGEFALSIPFDPPLGPRTVVELVPVEVTRPEGVSDFVAFALTEFLFVSDAGGDIEPLKRGQIVRFSNAAPDEPQVLGAGWWDLEANHVWSSSAVSELRLSSLETISEIVLTVRPNPTVDEQTLTATLNGETLFKTTLKTADEPARITLDVTETFVAGGSVNRLRLLPDPLMQPPTDPRLLGICLLSLTLN